MFIPRMFYAQPGDAPPTGQSAGNAGVGGKSSQVIDIKYKGEQRKFDLSKPEDLQIIRDYASKGHAYEEGQKSIGKLREQIDGWNQLITDAGKNDDSWKHLLGIIEKSTGRTLTKSEEETISSKITELDKNDPYMKKLDELNNKFIEMEKSTKQKEVDREADRIVKTLHSMEKQKDKYPFFKKDEVMSAAEETGITDFDKVYNILYTEKIIEAKTTAAVEEKAKLLARRRGAYGETEPHPAGTGGHKEPLQGKNLDEIGEAVYKRLQDEGKSFFN